MSSDRPFGGLPPEGDPTGWEPPTSNYPNPGQPQHGYPGQGPAVPPPQAPSAGSYPAPGGASPYGQPPASGQPRKKRRVWLWLLLGIPLLMLLGIGGCTALLFTSLRPPIDTTNAFVANLDDGDLRAAYDSFCEPIKASVGYDVWATAITRELGGEITDYSFTQASVVNSNGNQSATVTGTLEIDGASRPAEYDLIKEGGTWRVCS